MAQINSPEELQALVEATTEHIIETLEVQDDVDILQVLTAALASAIKTVAFVLSKQEGIGKSMDELKTELFEVACKELEFYVDSIQVKESPEGGNDNKPIVLN